MRHMASSGFSGGVSGLTILALKSELRHSIWNVNCSNIFREALVSGIVFKDRGLGFDRFWIYDFSENMNFWKMNTMILE
jgi:hypothetical protein